MDDPVDDWTKDLDKLNKEKPSVPKRKEIPVRERQVKRLQGWF